MSASTPSPSRKEEDRAALAITVGASIALFAVGFASGWKRGRMDLLASLIRAQRIQRHLAKEE